jgi:hypothetical protein
MARDVAERPATVREIAIVTSDVTTWARTVRGHARERSLHLALEHRPRGGQRGLHALEPPQELELAQVLRGTARDDYQARLSLDRPIE